MTVPLSGFRLAPAYLDRPTQQALLAALSTVFAYAPLYTPRMPKSGRPLTVRMTNCGPLGWVTDEGGYRYQPYSSGPGYARTGLPPEPTGPPMPMRILPALTMLERPYVYLAAALAGTGAPGVMKSSTAFQLPSACCL